jgi:hypothetical protein
VVCQYVHARTESSLPGRWSRLPDCFVWRRGSVRPGHGLRRLRRALYAPAVSASSLPPSFAASTNGMR